MQQPRLKEGLSRARFDFAYQLMACHDKIDVDEWSSGGRAIRADKGSRMLCLHFSYRLEAAASMDFEIVPRLGRLGLVQRLGLIRRFDLVQRFGLIQRFGSGFALAVHVGLGLDFG